MKYAEQIAAYLAKKAAADERITALHAKSTEEGRTFDAQEKEEIKAAEAEIKEIDEHVSFLQRREAAMVSRGTPITVVGGADGAGQREGSSVELRGGGNIISVRPNVAKGVTFARYAIALARARGNIMHAAEIAKQWDSSTPEVGLFIKEIVKYGSVDAIMKTAVAAGTTSDSTWAGPLVYAQNMVQEFIEYLRPQTIIGRLPRLRRVPFNVRIPRQTSGTSGTFVGEGAPTPVQKAAFDAITLTWAKASTISVLTQELVMNSNPAAESLVRDDLAAGITNYLDKRFIDPSYAGVANTSPASVSNGVTSRQASGSTLASIDQDVAYVLSQVAAADVKLDSAIWLMSPSEAISLGAIRTTYGDLAFPELGVQGGTFKGLPAITSNSVVSSGSPGEQQIFLLVQDEILLADDGQMLLDMSTEASVQMNDAPSAGAQSLVSLWQDGLVGLKCDRWINWTKRRSQAVQYIEAAQRYGS